MNAIRNSKKKDLDNLNNRLEIAQNRIDDNKGELDSMDGEIAKGKRGKTQKFRLPKEKGKSSKNVLWVLVRYGKIYPVLESMQKNGMPLLVHGEITHKEVDIFDREAAFIDQVLEKTIKNFPSLKVVFEHITTKDAKDFVLSCKDNVAATITPHHLLANRNNMLVGGIQPHYYCLPVLKREDPHQLALLDAATSGNPKFFLGTDSAPHPKESKESSCGCAGILNSHCAIELYATAFESKDALDKLEGFASKFGPDFYSLPRNKETITITKQQWKVPNSYVLGNSTVVPFMAGENISWKMD